MFGIYKIKHISTGSVFQVAPENIPLITDILDDPDKFEREKTLIHDQAIERDSKNWDCTRLTEDEIGKFNNYSEELTLTYQNFFDCLTFPFLLHK